MSSKRKQRHHISNEMKRNILLDYEKEKAANPSYRQMDHCRKHNIVKQQLNNWLKMKNEVILRGDIDGLGVRNEKDRELPILQYILENKDTINSSLVVEYLKNNDPTYIQNFESKKVLLQKCRRLIDRAIKKETYFSKKKNNENEDFSNVPKTSKNEMGTLRRTKRKPAFVPDPLESIKKKKNKTQKSAIMKRKDESSVQYLNRRTQEYELIKDNINISGKPL